MLSKAKPTTANGTMHSAASTLCWLSHSQKEPPSNHTSMTTSDSMIAIWLAVDRTVPGLLIPRSIHGQRAGWAGLRLDAERSHDRRLQPAGRRPSLANRERPCFTPGRAVGTRYSCGRGVSGTAYCWGVRLYRRSYSIAQPQSGGLPFAKVAAGSNSVCATRRSIRANCFHPR